MVGAWILKQVDLEHFVEGQWRVSAATGRLIRALMWSSTWNRCIGGARMGTLFCITGAPILSFNLVEIALLASKGGICYAFACNPSAP